MILVSACLLGINCKYNGKNNLNSNILKLDGNLVPVCPEQLGGLSTPRPPCEIIEGDGHDVLQGNAKVVTENGVDVSSYFIAGAKMTAKIAEITKAETAILKANSPSCGSNSIYDGTFSCKQCPGDGVTAALLKQMGIKVFTEIDFPE